MSAGILDNIPEARGKMPPVDASSSHQNGWVQDWLLAWAKENTVFGSYDWEKEAARRIAERPDWAKMFRVTITRQVKDAEIFQSVIDLIQETYDYTRDANESACG